MSLIKRTIKKVYGFTLIEVITILFIVSLALVGVLSLVVQSLNSQSYNKNNLVAYQLAQEGVELIRHVRDSNWRANQTWNNNLGEGVYYMDYLDSAPHPLSSASQSILKIDGNGFYFHDPSGLATSSGFSRTLKITALSANDLYLRVNIAWLDHGRNYSYDLDTSLYDWK